MGDLIHVYDPVKAHEYYIQNRELKGRKKASPEDVTTQPQAKIIQPKNVNFTKGDYVTEDYSQLNGPEIAALWGAQPTSGKKSTKKKTRVTLTPEQREALRVARERLSDEKKAKIDAEIASRQQKIKEIRAKAEQAKEELVAKLTAMARDLKAKSVERQAKMDEELQAKIKALPPISILTISPERRKALVEERQKDIAKMRSDNEAEKVKLKNQDADALTAFGNQRKNIMSNMESAIDDARDKCNQARDQIYSDYRSQYQSTKTQIMSGK